MTVARTPTLLDDADAFARALHPDGTGPGHPVELADEAARAWAGESYHRGIAFGVAAERFRRRILAAAG